MSVFMTRFPKAKEIVRQDCFRAGRAHSKPDRKNFDAALAILRKYQAHDTVGAYTLDFEGVACEFKTESCVKR